MFTHCSGTAFQLTKETTPLQIKGLWTVSNPTVCTKHDVLRHRNKETQV
jgi:hypothetical protein